MPGTLWSAPVPALNSNSQVFSPATATLTDISPAQVIINPPQLNVGTRVRLVAHGSYIATTTASTVTYGFYMTAASTATAANNLVATSAVLGVSSAITAVAVTGIPWHLQYWGVIQKISSPVIGLTNATIVGRGMCNTGASLTAWAASPSTIPQTLATVTVAQTGTPGFGMVTNIAQMVSVGVTIATNTGFTSITCDELTCELLG
jgi:hypothetical protein